MANLAKIIAASIVLTANVLGEDYQRAAEYWREAVSREKDYAIGLINLAFAELMLDDYSNAAIHYKNADAISESLDAKAGAQWALLAEEKNTESIAWGNAALTIDPNNFWVRKRLALAYAALEDDKTAERFFDDLALTHGTRALTPMPRATLMPYYQTLDFLGSSQKSTGYDTGAYASWNFDSGYSIGGGYSMNEVAKPGSTTPYSTREFRAHAAKTFSNLSAFTITGHLLSSNYSYLDKAWTLSATWRPRFYSNFTLTTSVLSFSAHGGASLEPAYTFNLAKGWSLGIGAMGQVISFSTVTNIYGAATANLRYCRSIFCVAGGGLFGSLYTPLLESGSVLIYGLDQLTSQAYGSLSVYPLAWLEIRAAYTYGTWKSFSGETPVSSAISLAITGTLW